MSSKSPPSAPTVPTDAGASESLLNDGRPPGGESSDLNHGGGATNHTSSSPTTKKPSSPSLRRTKSPSVKKLKPSFWKGLVAVLLPCVGSKKTEKTHDISLSAPNDGLAIKEKAHTQDVARTSSEKQSHDDVAAPLSSSAIAGQSSTTAVGQSAQDSAPSTPTRSAATKPAPLTVPSASKTADVDENVATIIVPPSPTSQLLPQSETKGVTAGAVQAPGSTGTEHSPHLVPPTTAGTVATTTITTDSDDASLTDEAEAEAVNHDADMDAEDEDDEEERLIAQGGTGIPVGPDGQPQPLLPPVLPQHKGRKCLVLDLDETLLHSSFKLIPQADYVVPVEIEWQWHNVYVIKRPGVDNFLKEMGQIYEVVVFTASLSKYADPVLDKLDIHKVVTHRLFRESCYNHKGNYVKDLSRLGRPIADTIILDNSPASYIFHPNNAVPVSSWFNDPHDTELTDLCPFLSDLAPVDDVRGILDGGI